MASRDSYRGEPKTPKALTSLKPGLRTLSALPWVTEHEFGSTLKGLRRKGQVRSIRELFQSSMDSKSFVPRHHDVKGARGSSPTVREGVFRIAKITPALTLGLGIVGDFIFPLM